MNPKFRKGDVITIRATVVDGRPSESIPDKIYVEPFGHHANIFVSADAVELVHRFFAPRDRVTHRDNGFAGEVVATFDDQCWIHFDSGTLATVYANDLAEEVRAGLELVA